MENDILERLSTAQGSDLRALLPEFIQELARVSLAYEKFRKVKLSCWSDAKDAAGEKPVTDTYLERAIIARYSVEVLEEGKSLYHRLEALMALSAVLAAYCNHPTGA